MQSTTLGKSRMGGVKASDKPVKLLKSGTRGQRRALT